jgi:hypothetical protein
MFTCACLLFSNIDLLTSMQMKSECQLPTTLKNGKECKYGVPSQYCIVISMMMHFFSMQCILKLNIYQIENLKKKTFLA